MTSKNLFGDASRANAREPKTPPPVVNSGFQAEGGGGFSLEIPVIGASRKNDSRILVLPVQFREKLDFT